MEGAKHKNFSEEEDIMILRQVLAEPPFQQGYGKVMGAWDKVAQTLSLSPDFPRDEISGKTAQNGFNFLISAGRKHNAESAKMSGIDEEESELHLLLDELIMLVDDNEASKKGKLMAKKCDSEANEQDDHDPLSTSENANSTPNKMQKIVEIVAIAKEKELEFLKMKWEVERSDRLAAEEARRADNERMMAILEMLAKKQ
ncbi:hypothetical protein AC1031_009317 [Aphanomyces cochlioides]|nr:hypothetical protein AC1031_009317 [Aphanomyces cochlioides]